MSEQPNAIPLAKMRDVSGPAFPTEPNTQPGFYAHHGMSLRDWFAGQALIGMMRAMVPFSTEYGVNAKRAYASADAMLAERAKAPAQSEVF